MFKEIASRWNSPRGVVSERQAANLSPDTANDTVGPTFGCAPSRASFSYKALAGQEGRALDDALLAYRRSWVLFPLAKVPFVALAFFAVAACADVDLSSVGLTDEELPAATDLRIIIDQSAGSPGSELTRVTPVLDVVLEHAARAPGSRVRAFALVEEGPPRSLLDVTTAPLPSRPRARDRHVERFVAEQRARVLDALTPSIDRGLARSEIADTVDRVARLELVPGADDIELCIVSDLREESAFGRFTRRRTLPTIHQVILRASARHIFEPASFAGIDVVVTHALLPGRRMDSSASHEARLRERWEALFHRAGAASVVFASGPPSFDSVAQEQEE